VIFTSLQVNSKLHVRVALFSERAPALIEYEDTWAPEFVWIIRKQEESHGPYGIQTPQRRGRSQATTMNMLGNVAVCTIYVILGENLLQLSWCLNKSSVSKGSEIVQSWIINSYSFRQVL